MEWSKLLDDWRYRWVVEGKRPDPDPFRTEYEKDYDRAVFSSPVRRLQDKAQVFPLDPSDAVRTRLTHSLEVSTVARDMARAVGKWILANYPFELDNSGHDPVRAMETIAATCGLLHDLGNPPFGHFGETAIRDWFASQSDEIFDGLDDNHKQDFLKFEGNAQTLRLVTKLQLLADNYGLNLTCGTLSALCKYTASSTQAGTNKQRHDWSKPGHFTSEAKVIDTIRSQTGTGDARHPLTFLVEASDDIVYRLVDLEDGVKKGVIDWKTAESILKDKGGHQAGIILGEAKQLLEKGNPSGRLRDEAWAQAFRIMALRRFVPSIITEFQNQYEPIMRGEYYDELTRNFEHKAVLESLGTIAVEHIFSSPDILRLELRGHRVIGDLMSLFWKGAQQSDTKPKTFAHKAYSLISDNYRQVCNAALDTGDLPKNYCRLQLVTDYICGMTDSFACSLHKQLTNG